MIVSVLLSAMLAAAPAPTLVDVGKGDFSAFPQLRAVERRLPSPAMVERVEKMLAAGECKIPGQRSGSFDITVPYAVQIQPDGSVKHVIVSEIGCPSLETYVGMIVLQRSQQGDFRPSQAAQTRWYSDDLNFNLR